MSYEMNKDEISIIIHSLQEQIVDAEYRASNLRIQGRHQMASEVMQDMRVVQASLVTKIWIEAIKLSQLTITVSVTDYTTPSQIS